jgi:hypothetical protein
METNEPVNTVEVKVKDYLMVGIKLTKDDKDKFLKLKELFGVNKDSKVFRKLIRDYDQNEAN